MAHHDGGLFSMWFPSSKFHRIGRLVLDFVLPRTCLQCGCLLEPGTQGYACAACRARYAIIREPQCRCCGVPFYGHLLDGPICRSCTDSPPRFRQARSVFLYRGTGARLIHSLKYEQGIYLQQEISELLRGDARWRDFFVNSLLVPVPLHPRKFRKRGYNQAEIITQAIREVVPEAGICDCLKRIRMTPSQTFLSRSERLKNMRGAFRCASLPPGERSLLIVDDVLTTGATLNAAAAALEAAGATDICAFTLAHG
jgi:competence protein ComFC